VPLPPSATDILCRVLVQLRSIPLLGPVINALLAVFRCPTT
jgi:hypothetical protein